MRWATRSTAGAPASISRRQYADYTLFVAEVASTVNENLLIEQLLANENDPQTRLYLLNQYLEKLQGHGLPPDDVCRVRARGTRHGRAR